MKKINLAYISCNLYTFRRSQLYAPDLRVSWEIVRSERCKHRGSNCTNRLQYLGWFLIRLLVEFGKLLLHVSRGCVTKNTTVRKSKKGDRKVSNKNFTSLNANLDDSKKVPLLYAISLRQFHFLHLQVHPFEPFFNVISLLQFSFFSLPGHVRWSCSNPISTKNVRKYSSSRDRMSQ